MIQALSVIGEGVNEMLDDLGTVKVLAVIVIYAIASSDDVGFLRNDTSLGRSQCGYRCDVPSSGDGKLLGLLCWQRIIKQCPKHRGS